MKRYRSHSMYVGKPRMRFVYDNYKRCLASQHTQRNPRARTCDTRHSQHNKNN